MCGIACIAIGVHLAKYQDATILTPILVQTRGSEYSDTHQVLPVQLSADYFD